MSSLKTRVVFGGAGTTRSQAPPAQLGHIRVPYGAGIRNSTTHEHATRLKTRTPSIIIVFLSRFLCNDLSNVLNVAGGTRQSCGQNEGSDVRDSLPRD